MGLSDIMDLLPGGGSNLVTLGNIKIGGKSRQARKSASGNVWFAPIKYDSFHLTTMNRDETGHLIEDDRLMKELVAVPGCSDNGKLRAIPIRLLSDDIEEVLQSSICWYGRKSIGARSDGKTVRWFYDPKTMKPYDPPIDAPFTPEMLTWKAGSNPMFKIHSIFNCVVASSESRWGGVYRFRTTSVISFKQLHASLLHLGQLTGGILIGMPLMLCLRPMQVSPEGNATTVHVAHVELRGGDLKQIQGEALEQMRFRLQFRDQVQKTAVQYRKLLAGPGMEENGEAAEIAAEFQSDEVAEDPDEGHAVASAPDSKVAALAAKFSRRPVSEGQRLEPTPEALAEAQQEADSDPQPHPDQLRNAEREGVSDPASSTGARPAGGGIADRSPSPVMVGSAAAPAPQARADTIPAGSSPDATPVAGDASQAGEMAPEPILIEEPRDLTSHGKFMEWMIDAMAGMNAPEAEANAWVAKRLGAAATNMKSADKWTPNARMAVCREFVEHFGGIMIKPALAS